MRLLLLAVFLLRHPEIPVPPEQVERVEEDSCSSMCSPECEESR